MFSIFIFHALINCQGLPLPSNEGCRQHICHHRKICASGIWGERNTSSMRKVKAGRKVCILFHHNNLYSPTLGLFSFPPPLNTSPAVHKHAAPCLSVRQPLSTLKQGNSTCSAESTTTGGFPTDDDTVEGRDTFSRITRTSLVPGIAHQSCSHVFDIDNLSTTTRRCRVIPRWNHHRRPSS